MPNRYDTLTAADFDRLLRDVIDRQQHDLLAFPGVYAIVSEHYHHEVLTAWDQEHADADGADRAR